MVEEATFTKFKDLEGKDVFGRDLKYDTAPTEGGYEYKLEDGTIINLTIEVAKISRGEDPETKEFIYTEQGEPLYSIRHQLVIKTKVPFDLLKK